MLDETYKKHAMKKTKEHPLVGLFVFAVGTLVGVVPLIIFAKKRAATNKSFCTSTRLSDVAVVFRRIAAAVMAPIPE